MSVFAMAAVMSSEYHDRPLVVFGPYGFATAVSLVRVGSMNHFPSDVLAVAIGELIGRYVVHHRKPGPWNDARLCRRFCSQESLPACGRLTRKRP